MDANNLFYPETTFPPFVSQSALLALTQPGPLQLFCPAQACVAVAQAPVPLQELMPEHLISATFVASGAAAFSSVPALFEEPPQPASNNVAVADASATPDNFDKVLILYLLR